MQAPATPMTPAQRLVANNCKVLERFFNVGTSEYTMRSEDILQAFRSVGEVAASIVDDNPMGVLEAVEDHMRCEGYKDLGSVYGAQWGGRWQDKKRADTLSDS